MSAHDTPPSFGLPPSAVPSSRPPSVAPPSEHLIYMRKFLDESLIKLGVSNTYPVPSDREPNHAISTGEALILPLLCSSINALASLLDKVDTLTNRLTHIHDSVSKVANTVPNKEEITACLATISLSVRDLSHRISTALSRPPLAHQPPPPIVAKPRTKLSLPAALKDDGPTLDPNFPRVDTVSDVCYGDPAAFAKCHPDSWETSHFATGSYSRIPRLVPGHLDPFALAAPTRRWPPPPPPRTNPEGPPLLRSPSSLLPPPPSRPDLPLSLQPPGGFTLRGRFTPHTQTGTPLLPPFRSSRQKSIAPPTALTLFSLLPK